MEWGDFCSARCAETAADTLPDRPEAANDTGVYAKTSRENRPEYGASSGRGGGRNPVNSCAGTESNRRHGDFQSVCF
jgi:hypothetical protein